MCSKVWHHLLFLMAKILPSFQSCLCICAVKNLYWSGDKGHLAVTLDGRRTQHSVWRSTDTVPEVTARLILAHIKAGAKTGFGKQSLITQTKHSDPAEHPRAASGTGAVSQAMDTCFITLSISCETNFFFCPPRNKRSMFLCSISSHAKICICPIILPEAWLHLKL